MSGYACKTCGAPAAVSRNGVVTRSCRHTGTVVMDLEAVCVGEGRASDEAAAVRLLRRFQGLGVELVRRMRGGHGLS